MQDLDRANDRSGSFTTDAILASSARCLLCPESDRRPIYAACRDGRVEDGRGSLGHAAALRFPSPLIGRVEDWRAGVGRSLCSLLSRPFVCECHTISTIPRFQPPPRRTQRADFLALRSPVCFTSRLMEPILSERLSTSVAEPGSR